MCVINSVDLSERLKLKIRKIVWGRAMGVLESWKVSMNLSIGI